LNHAAKGLQALRRHLSTQPQGPILDDQTESLLGASWNELEGAHEGGMFKSKLKGRTEDLAWNPPMLSFRIERHGAPMLGSRFAEVSEWTIDVETGTATRNEGVKRAIAPPGPALRTAPIADELAALIAAGSNDPRLKWNGPDEVRYQIGLCVPDGKAKQTTIGRRMRFKKQLEITLDEQGWEKAEKQHTFRRRKR
jgi:hypothetical protein